MGGDAVISAAMPLQPSPRSDTPLCLTQGDPDVMSSSDCRSPRIPPPPFPLLLSLVWFSPSSLIYLERALQVKVYIKKKDYREIEIKVEIESYCKNAEIMHSMTFRGGMYRKPVNIVYFEFENIKI